MNLLSWLVAFTTLVILMLQAVGLHKATVCRQEAWLKSTELLTRSLLSADFKEKEWHLRCQLLIIKNQDQILWQRLPSVRKHQFFLEINGKL